jgi:hypothetical protein
MRILPLFILSVMTSCIQQEAKKITLSPEKVYNIITPLFFQLDSLYPYITIDGDSLNNNIADSIIRYRDAIMALPDSSGFRELLIVKSLDQRICMISWNTRQGGTNTDNRALILFKSSKGIDYRYPADTAAYASTQIMYRDIYELHASNRVIYIARGFGRGSTALPWEQLTAWSIRNDSLIPEPIFPEMSDTEYSYKNDSYLPALFIEFDVHHNSGPEERPVTGFADRNKKIKVPLPNDKGGWSDNFCRMGFDGERYRVEK